MACDKVRVRFRKAGDLRLLSHHDLMRTFERMLRRAGLPFHSTQGFNPKPRMVFASALALGIVGADEIVELEFDQPQEAEDVRRRLAAQAPAGLEILGTRRLDPRARARVRRAVYRVPVPPADRTALAGKVAALLATAEWWVERSRPRPQRVNIRPHVRQLRTTPAGLEMDLWIHPDGSARPDEILTLLGLGHLLRQGTALERSQLELEDEAEDGVAALSVGTAADAPAVARNRKETDEEGNAD